MDGKAERDLVGAEQVSHLHPSFILMTAVVVVASERDDDDEESRLMLRWNIWG